MDFLAHRGVPGEHRNSARDAGQIQAAKACGANLIDSGEAGRLQEKILGANPILEAFGNAATQRNGNSSRFGRLNKMHFDAGTGLLCGATVTTFVLERSRVVHQCAEEQNFHIFYQLLAGNDGRQAVGHLHRRFGE
eukprot:Polyplicarium_translucidae@DN1457_c0_g1_i4.p1